MSVCKYLERNLAELHNDAKGSKNDMLFTTVMLTREVHNDDRCIVICSFCHCKLGQQMHILDVTNDELIKSFVIHKRAFSMCIHSYDVFVVSSSHEGDIIVLDARTGKTKFMTTFVGFEVDEICLHGNATHSKPLHIILTKTGDLNIYIYDIEGGNMQWELSGHRAHITTIQVIITSLLYIHNEG